jgi:hypothetical protein
MELKALGTLGIWVHDPTGDQSRWQTTNLMVMIQGRPIPEARVQLSKTGVSEQQKGATVIEIDVLGAWKEMNLQPGWSNEVGVEVFIS